MYKLHTVTPHKFGTSPWWSRVLEDATSEMGCPHILDVFKNPTANTLTYAITITHDEVPVATAFYIDEQDTLTLTFHLAIKKSFYRKLKNKPTKLDVSMIRSLFTSDYITRIPYIVVFLPRTNDTTRDDRKVARLVSLTFAAVPRVSDTHYCYYAKPAEVRAVLDKIKTVPYSLSDCGWA